MARRAWGAGGVVVLVVLAACGGGTGSEAGATRVMADATRRLAEDTVRIRTVVRSTDRGHVVVVARSTAAIDFRRHESRTTLAGTGGLPQTEIRIVDGVSYMKSAAFPTPVTAGPGVAAGPAQSTKPWLRVTDHELADVDDELRPERLLARLRAVASIEADGTERVDGAATTRYRLTVPAGRRPPAAITAWIDAAGRLRRLVARGRDHGAAFTATTELSGFGAPVVVTAPPAEQVFDLTAPRVPNRA